MCDYEYRWYERASKNCPYDENEYKHFEHNGKRYCIFHAPIDVKDDNEFWKAFFELIEKFKSENAKEWDFEGFVFPNTGDRFQGYKFPEQVRINFRYVTFSGWADFGEATFTSVANFWRVTFMKWAYFRDTTFSNEANFRGATFSGGVYFIKTKFLNYLNLYSANFHSEVNFQGAYLSEVEFTGATFRVPPYMANIGAGSEEVKLKNFVGDVTIAFNKGIFDIASEEEKDEPFNGKINGGNYKGIFNISSKVKSIEIENTTFEGTVKINPEATDDKTVINIDNANLLGNISISDVRVEKIKDSLIGESFVLRDSDLRKASFENTNDLRNIDFINIDEWHKYDRNKFCLSGSLKNLDGLYDEEEECKDNHKTLAEMYRAVATSYESRNRYGSAGPFKVGEYEMRRKMEKTSKLEKAVLWLYKTVSSYGESLLKPLSLIFLTPLLSAFTLLFFKNPITCRYIFSINNIDICSILKNIGRLYVYSLKKTIALSFSGSELGCWASLILIFSKIFSAILIALLLFAVRRKVKR